MIEVRYSNGGCVVAILNVFDWNKFLQSELVGFRPQCKCFRCLWCPEASISQISTVYTSLSSLTLAISTDIN